MTQLELNRTAECMMAMVGREWTTKALHEAVKNGMVTSDMVIEALLSISDMEDDPMLLEPLAAIANYFK